MWAHHEEQHRPPGVLAAVAFEQRLNEPVPLHLAFRDEAGNAVQLGDYLGQKPVILTLNYYECPMLCPLVLEGLLRSLRALSFMIGEQFDVVTVSIDPGETAALAATTKARYIRDYGRPKAAAGWHFLTGDEASIQRLTQAVGFRYAYDAGKNQYAHAAGIMVLTPQGAFPGTSTASSFHLEICGWRSSKRRPTRSARRSTSCCCSVTSMIRRPAAIRWLSDGRCNWRAWRQCSAWQGSWS